MNGEKDWRRSEEIQVKSEKKKEIKLSVALSSIVVFIKGGTEK